MRKSIILTTSILLTFLACTAKEAPPRASAPPVITTVPMTPMPPGPKAKLDTPGIPKDNLVTFAKSYGGASDDKFADILDAGAGTFIAVGYTRENDQLQGYAVKVDNKGSVLKEVKLGQPDMDEYINSLTMLTDGTFLLAGGIKKTLPRGSQEKVPSHVFTVKVDADLKPLDSKIYQAVSSTDCEEVVGTRDGGALLVGKILKAEGDTENSDLYVLKIDKNSKILWEQSYGTPGVELARAGVETSTGDYVVTGYGGSRQNVLVVKYSSSGKEKWVFTQDLEYSQWGNSILETPEKNFLIAGMFQSVENQEVMIGGEKKEQMIQKLSVYLLGLSSDGTKILEKNFQPSSMAIAQAIKPTVDGNYFITGPSMGDQAKGTDILLIKIDSRGNSLWERVIGIDEGEYPITGVATSDGGYLLAGFITQKTVRQTAQGTQTLFTNPDGYLIRLNAMGGLN